MAIDSKPLDQEIGVIYARYSSSGQREESIEGQLRDCHAYAEKYGIRIVEEYCDRALTGTSDKRPRFQKMIRDSAKGQFSVVITWKNDRFARSRYDSAIYKAKLKQNGVRVLYAKEYIPDGPEGIILESVMEGFAEYYSANLSQNVKRGNYDSALKRQTLGQQVFGLRRGPDKRFEHDPATAPIVKRIFEEYAAGKSAKEIYTELNNEGFHTSRGNRFNKSSIRRILQNEKYIGVYEYGEIRDENGIPPIVDRALFEKVQEMVEKNHESPAAKKADGGFLLTSKLFCGECGKPMTGDSGTSKTGKVYSYYTCVGRRAKLCTKERAQKDWIEDVVVTKLAEIVNSDEMVNEIADRFMDWQARQNTDDVASGLEQQLREVNDAIKNNMDLIDSGFITDSVKSHLVELEGKRAALEVGIAKEKLAGSAPALERESVVWFLKRFRNEDPSDIRTRIWLVDTFLKAAYLYDDGRLLLHLNFAGDKSKISVKLAEKTVAEGEALSSCFAPSAVPVRDSDQDMIRVPFLLPLLCVVCYNDPDRSGFVRGKKRWLNKLNLSQQK